MFGLDRVLTTTLLSAETLTGQGLSSVLAIKLRRHTNYLTNHIYRFLKQTIVSFTYIKSGWMVVLVGYSENWSMTYHDESVHRDFQIYAWHS